MFVLLGTLGLAQAQVARPAYPAPRPAPAHDTAPPASAVTPTPAPSQPVHPNPAPAARPADGPVVPPVVTFRDGLLTVQAVNSNLSSVLTAIRNKAGIEFEGAENVSERVAISLGPAPGAEVLSAILGGSKYDFVAIGRPDNPAIVQRVILTVKNKPGAVAETQPQQRPANGQEGDEEDNPDETVNSPGGDPQDTPVQPPPQPPPQAQSQPQQQPPSPEQLLQQLQQMPPRKIPQEEQSPAQAPRKQPPL